MLGSGAGAGEVLLSQVTFQKQSAPHSQLVDLVDWGSVGLDIAYRFVVVASHGVHVSNAKTRHISEQLK